MIIRKVYAFLIFYSALYFGIGGSEISTDAKRQTSNNPSANHFHPRIKRNFNAALNLFVGEEDFKNFRLKNDIYVDKSLLIKEILGEKATNILIFIRPPGWGKSLNLNMLEKFFSIEIENISKNILPKEQWQNAKLFLGGEMDREDGSKKILKPLKIAKYEKLLKRHQGKYAVFLVDFKNITGKNYQEYLVNLQVHLTKAFQKFYLFMGNEKQRERGKKRMIKFILKYVSHEEVLKNLLFFSEFLKRRYKKKVILLIDNFNAPIIEAGRTLAGNETELDKVYELFYHFYYISTKYKEKYVKKIILTGTYPILLDVFQGQICDLENSNNFFPYFGFMESEVEKIIAKWPNPIDQKKIKEWYSGYRLGKDEFYNPWSLMNCLGNDGKIANYIKNRVNTTYVKCILNAGILQKEIESLFKGGTVRIRHKKKSKTEDLSQRETFIKILQSGGYLTVKFDESKSIYTYFVPNKEMNSTYNDQKEKQKYQFLE